MPPNDQFNGWAALSPTSTKGEMVWQPFTPKPFLPTDVEIAITHCGICGSDMHTMSSGWSKTPYPCVVGHEIIGRATRVGSSVSHIKPGDRVGVGAQSGSCLKTDCEACSQGLEQHCPRIVNTYAGKFPDGSMSYGGYADRNRCPGHFVVKIPDALRSEDAASMMCAGITMYSPLKHEGCGPGKAVGIVGLGGLGHYGVLFAKALGAEKVVVISRTSEKKADAMRMGAEGFIATNEEQKWWKNHRGTLDLIVSTVSSPKMPLGGYLSLLRMRGAFIQVGAPEDKLPGFSAFGLITNGCKIGGSCIGSPKEIAEMLQLAADKGIKPWIEQRPMKYANQAVVDMEAGRARYRYVLVNEEKRAGDSRL